MSEFEFSKKSYIEKHNDSLVLGLTHDDFRRQKITWVESVLKKTSEIQHVLDFGFGTGELLEDMERHKVAPLLSGVEPSATLRAEFSGRNPNNRYRKIAASLEELADHSLDVVTCFNVLHHIPPTERKTIANQIARKLKPGGRFLVWEHNPFNPGTRFVVCRCEYDHDAVLLRAKEVEELSSSLSVESLEFVNFTPPSMQKLGLFRKLEKWMRDIPLGAQYRMILRSKA